MNRTSLLSLSLAIGSLLPAWPAGAAEDSDWPRWRGPNGDGISMETDWDPEALAGGPKILWKVNIGLSHSNVAIKANRLYTMGQRGRENIIYCFNAETGEEIWKHSFECFQDPQSTPNLDNKYVYALSKDGILLCLTAKNGKVQWQKDIIEEYNVEIPGYGIAGSPIIEGDLLILNANTSGITLDKKTGNKIWASEPHTRIKDAEYYATPVIYDYKDKRCALLFSGDGLFSVDVITGNQYWFFEWRHTNVADPIVDDNKFFISTGYSYDGCVLFEIIDNEPKVVWQNKNMNNRFSTSLLIDGYLYGCDRTSEFDSHFHCLDFSTGDIMWEKEMRTASLIVAAGKFIILEEDGTLHIAEATPSSYKDLSSGDVLEGERTFRKFWTPPVLYKGKIYCRNYGGDLICIDVSK